MADRIQIRRDTAANWTTSNPTLADGEIGLEKDTGKFKAGNGSTAWNSLNYISAPGIFDSIVTPAKLHDEFKTTVALTGTAVDWTAGLRFTKTITGATTLTFSNLHIGVKLLEITGDYAVTLPAGFVYAGGTRPATGPALIQVVCTDTSTPAGWYIILKDES